MTQEITQCFLLCIRSLCDGFFQRRIAAVRWTSRCLLLTPSCSYSWVVQRSAAWLRGQGNAMGKMTRNKQSQATVWSKNNRKQFPCPCETSTTLVLLLFDLSSTTLSQHRSHCNSCDASGVFFQHNQELQFDAPCWSLMNSSSLGAGHCFHVIIHFPRATLCSDDVVFQMSQVSM